jgi:hypothetical protein
MATVNSITSHPTLLTPSSQTTQDTFVASPKFWFPFSTTLQAPQLSMNSTGQNGSPPPQGGTVAYLRELQLLNQADLSADPDSATS